jgi:ribosomal protein S18 acetylase RimI-like enzyme
MKIRQANQSDIEHISIVYRVCFPNEVSHEVWINACFNSFPKSVYYVYEESNEVQGYILWSVKNGFRTKAIIELDQLGVHPDSSRQGIGRKLITQSFEIFKSHLAELGLGLGSVIVTTSEGNYAEELYKSTLGVTRNGIIKEYGSGNELILFNKIKT